MPLARARQLVQEGEYQLLLYVPPGFGERMERFRDQLLNDEDAEGPDIAPEQAAVEPVDPLIFHNTASEKSQIAHARVTRVLHAWEQQIVEQNLEVTNVPPRVVKPFQFDRQDLAEKGHRDAAMWSKLLPFVLLIWALTGAFYPAVDLCAGEKERGTLETLLSSPAERVEIVWGKLLTVMTFSIATAVLNLASMALTGTFILAQLNRLGTLGAGAPLAAPPPSAALWLLLALIPVSALFSALCLALAAFARSTKEGQYYLMPLLLITMPLMVMPMAPGVELNLGNSLIPVTGVVLLLRTTLEGNTMQALPFIPPVVAVTLTCCLFAIRWAVDQFNSESVLFRESERLDLGLWLRRLMRDRGPTPSIAEAFCCILLIFMIQFFMNLALRPPENFNDLAALTFISQVVVIALPALLMTILLTSSPRQTLLLRRPIKWTTLPAAVLLAVFLHPVILQLGQYVQRLYPPGKEIQTQIVRISELLDQAPSLWWTLLLIALLPALCEEIAFRGFILSGLRHIGHKSWAIAISAIGFGLAHPILQQSITATLTGAVLAFVAIQSGSLLTCFLMHMTHNGLMILLQAASKQPELADRYPPLRWLQSLAVEDGGGVYKWPVTVICLVAAGGLLVWFRRLPYQKSNEEQFQEVLDHQSASSPSEVV
jgi:sodium transport system permease protein